MLADRIRMTLGKSRKLIDRTEPNLVERISSVTRGNGGRKLVRRDDGTLITIIHNSTGSLLYKSVNNGLTWNLLRNIGYDAIDTAIVAKGDNIYVLYTYGYGVYMRVFSKEGTLVNSTTVDSGLQVVKECSLVWNNERNELHASWTSKNAKYPNNFNIRYCKGVVQSSGTVTWDNVEEVTGANETNYHYEYVSIIVDSNNHPLISTIYRENYGYSVRVIGKNGLLPASGSYVNYPWHLAIVFPYTRESKFNTCICTDNDGGIHLTWHGDSPEKTGYDVMYSKSIDGGRIWSVPKRVAPPDIINTSYPSIAVNKKGEVFIALTREARYVDIYKRINENTWNNEISYTYAWHPHLMDDNNIEFVYPLTICKTHTYNTTYENSVVFTGKWYE